MGFRKIKFTKLRTDLRGSLGGLGGSVRVAEGFGKFRVKLRRAADTSAKPSNPKQRKPLTLNLRP